MKTYILLIVLFLFSISASSQAKPTDSLPPDSVVFVSARDFAAFVQWLPKNITHEEYINLTPENTLVVFYQWMLAEWRKKNKKK